MRATIETYYAIRIGTPGRHSPYFMLGPDSKVPWLFLSRKDAEKECPKRTRFTHSRVVKVRLINGRIL